MIRVFLCSVPIDTYLLFVFYSIIFLAVDEIQRVVLNLSEANKVNPMEYSAAYPSEEKPVFFGHYWLEGEVPILQAPNVCCVDYSVANQGKLVAYRFDGETELRKEKFCW
jgi:hypothetical protein